MNRIKQCIGDLTIQKKIIFYMYVVLIPILVGICVAVTIYRYESLRTEYDQQQRQTVSTLRASLDIIEEDVRNLSLNLAINDDIHHILTAASAESINRDVRLWQNRGPLEMVEDNIALKGYVKTLSIYAENGVRPYLRCMDASSYLADFEEVKQRAVYKAAAQKLGKALWVAAPRGGDAGIYQMSRYDKLVLCRVVFNGAKTQPLGYITIGISQKSIEELCANMVDKETEGLIVYEKYGQELLRFGNVDEEAGQFVASHTAEGRTTYRDWEIYEEYVTDGQWRICKIAPRVSFFEVVKEFGYIPLLLLLGISFGVLPLLYVASNTISKPLEHVCVAMGKFRQGDFEQQVEINTKDEVGEVAACFNQMVTDIRQLINKNYVMVLKEQESELAILQAQINPHFLYNALDSIYWQAIGEDDESTAESVYELAQLFRQVLGQGKSMVTVEMEMQLSERYLEIQKLRFHDQLNYTFEMDPAVKSQQIPKLILQPFVENAVIHGMQNDTADFSIAVFALAQDGFLKFFIRDTGVGMDEEQLRHIWEEDTDKTYSGQRIGRYAIKNVRERLRLKYDDRFQLNVESKVGEGTQVIVCIPLE